LAFSIVELDAKEEEFYKWSLQQFSIHSLRAQKQAKERNEDHELIIEMVRQCMALYVNSKVPEDKAVKPSDFFKLSYDKDQQRDRKLTLKESKELMGSKWKL